MKTPQDKRKHIAVRDRTILLSFKKKANQIAIETGDTFTMGDLVELVGKIPTKDLINYLN